MADKRAFAKFDVGYLDNPKMMDVLDRSLHAICMHFASVLYCAQHLTDGLVAPRAMQRKAGGTDTDTQLLIESGLWHTVGHDCESCPQPPADKVYVHDFLEHNRDAAEAKRVSQKRSDAAKVRWHGDASSNANSMQSALQNEPVCNAERERKKERKKPLSSPAAPATGFEEFWAAYPKKVAKQAAVKAWNKVTKTADPQAIIAGTARYAEAVKGQERQFIKSPDGWLNAGRWEDDYTQTATGQVPAAYGWFN